MSTERPFTPAQREWMLARSRAMEAAQRGLNEEESWAVQEKHIADAEAAFRQEFNKDPPGLRFLVMLLVGALFAGPAETPPEGA